MNYGNVTLLNSHEVIFTEILNRLRKCGASQTTITKVHQVGTI